MSPDQFERFQAQLGALEPEIKRMTGQSPKFVQDQLERLASYGINVRVTPRQQQWLDDLYEKHVGPLDGLPGGDDGRDQFAERGEILNDDRDGEDGASDDEIPF